MRLDRLCWYTTMSSDLLKTYALTSRVGLTEEDGGADSASQGMRLSIGVVVGLHMGSCMSSSSISGTWS